MAVKINPFELLFPRHCAVCDEVVDRLGEQLCDKCKGKIIYIKEPFCMKCGKQLKKEEKEKRKNKENYNQ